jgi:hypothetical protein
LRSAGGPSAVRLSQCHGPMSRSDSVTVDERKEWALDPCMSGPGTGPGTGALRGAP